MKIYGVIRRLTSRLVCQALAGGGIKSFERFPVVAEVLGNSVGKSVPTPRCSSIEGQIQLAFSL